MGDCPSALTLARVELDALNGSAFAAIEQHIDVCDRCQAELNRLDKNDRDPEGHTPKLPRSDDPPGFRDS